MSDKPRKRKDKKKKDSVSDAAEIARRLSTREDSDAGESTTPSGVQSMGPDDVQLHVHKDHGTGGHWCAKIVFFALLAILAGLVGLIILENRGLSDLDTPLSESRFSEILEGWVEENRESHDDHDEHEILASLEELEEHDEHDEPFEEEEDHEEEGGEAEDDEEEDDHGEEDDEEADDEDQEEEDQEDEDQEDEDEEADAEDDEGQEEDVDEGIDDGDDDTADDDDDENKTNEDEDEEDDEPDTRGPDTIDDEDDDNANDNENDEDDDDDQPDNDNNDDDDDDQPNNDDDDDDAPFEEQRPTNINNPVPLTQMSDTTEKTDTVTVADLDVQIEAMKIAYDEVAQQLGKPSFSELKVASQECPIEDFSTVDTIKLDDDGSQEDVIDNDAGEDLHLKKLAQKDEPEPDDTDDQLASPSSSLAEKILIGLALVVVAHSVLLRKTFNKEGKAAQEPEIAKETVQQSAEELIIDEGTIDMRRRLTIGTEEEPLPEPEDDLIYDDEGEELEYSGDEIEEEEELIEGSDEYEDEIADNVPMPETFEELNAMYKPKGIIQETPEVPKTTPKVTIETPEPQKKFEEVEEEYSGDEQEVEYDEEEELEGSDYEAEELSDVDDSELMKRLEEKYGKLPQTSDREDDDEDRSWTKIPPKSGAQSLEDDLQSANDDIEDNPRSALKAFDGILKRSPRTPEALYGRARALDRLSEMQQSNAILKDAIKAYEAVLRQKANVSDDLFTAAATRCIDRMRFLGLHTQAMPIHEALIHRFDDQPVYRNQKAISYLLLNQLADAKLVLHHTLLRWRHDPVALVHYGFVLKALDQDYEDAALYLTEGLATNAEGTQDGRFYFALGDSLMRLGKRKEAHGVFRLGAKKKLFLSQYQRSLYNVETLKSRPFWTIDETKNRQLFETLEINWKLIRDEGMRLLNQEGFFVDEAENLREKGDWKQLDLFVKGQKIAKHCQKAPLTCNIMESFPAARFCTRGQVKFSVMHPGTHVWPHCGPTNCRIRAHLGLKVPPGTSIRVAEETRSWQEGKMLIFDDSFEHEVWHNGTGVRLVLIVDIWHPDLTEEQRRSLHPI